MTRYLALLRGINVGGKNKLPMKDLVRLIEKCGARDVSTYIQSGNALFSASAKLASRFPKLLAELIDEELGLSTPVVLRSARELADALAENPFLTRTAKTDAFHVMFLADAPKPSAVAKLDPNRSRPDRFAVVGREIYLVCPNGLGRSKLTNDYFDRQLATVSTCRNWRTITKLSELLGS